MPVLSISDAVALEGDNQYLSFEVTLSEAALDTVSFTYRALGGTGDSADLNWGFDRTDRTTGTASLAPGQTSLTINIEANTDAIDERDESIILQLTNLSENASFDGGEDVLRATGVILDNDGTGPNLALFVSDPVLVEGDTGFKDAVFEVRLSRPAPEAFSVNYATRDITAIAGADYVARAGTLNFAAGEEVKSVSVRVLGDATPEKTESFSLVLDAPSSPTVGIEGLAGEAVIRDNDTGSGPVVSVSSVAALEGDNQYLSFEVTLSEAALDTVSFTYRALGGTGDSADLNWGFDRTNQTVGTAVFAPGQTSQIIYIEANTDAIDERDESIILQLTNLSENASFDGGEDVLRATGVILDNDGTGPNLALFVSDPVLVEGDTGFKDAVFEVRLSRPAPEAFSVNYATRDITAIAGADYVARAGTLNFAAGEEVKSVSVRVLGDATPEKTESFSLVLDAPSSPTVGIEGLAGEAVIRDNDTGSGPVVSVSSVAALEGDNQYLSFEVTLSEAALDTVSFTYRALGGTGDSADLNWGFDRTNQTVGTAVFAPGQTSQIIYIEANTDAIDERDESIILQLTNLSENASFDGGEDVLRATGVILDNDGTGPNLALFVSDPVLVEGDTGFKDAVFEVRLSRPAPEAFSVNYATRDITAIAGADYVPRIGTLNFATGETVKSVNVRVLGDEIAELTESFALVLTEPGQASVGTEGLVGEAVIRDDDTTPGPVVSVSNAVAIEADNQYLSFEVTLSQASTNVVRSDYRALAGTGESADLNWGFDSTGRTTGFVEFAPGQTSQIIYIEANSDALDERDETIFLELSNVVGATFADGAPTVQALGIILDNDGLGPNRIVTVAPTITREQSADIASYEIPIVMSQSAPVVLSFDVAAFDQSAVAGQDYRLLDSAITFLPGQTSTTVSVQIFGDARDENTETFGLSLTPQAGVPFVGIIPTGSVTVLNGPRIPTSSDDVLEGTSSPDEISLLAGNDFYNGLAGDDIARGGTGNDTLIGGSGNDRLFGDGGDDVLLAGIPSNGANTPAGQIYRIYQATLDRSPDTGGFKNWTDRLESGSQSIAEIVTGFVASPEFQNVYGELTNSEFVSLLYNNVLDREADAGGLAAWIGRLSSGLAREDVVIGFSESTEFNNKTNIEASAYADGLSGRIQSEYLDDVFRLYQATLNRAPDVNGLDNWSNQLASGQTYVSIAGGFTNSNEFRLVYGTLDNEGFVNQLYRNVLNREADTNGLNAWVDRIEGGSSREEIVRGFAQSTEFINNTQNSFTAFMKAGGGNTLEGGAGNDTLASGYSADTFVFNAAQGGTDVVLQLDAWDTLQFKGFGYGAAADAIGHMSTSGPDVRFADQGVSIIFSGAELRDLQVVDYEFI